MRVTKKYHAKENIRNLSSLKVIKKTRLIDNFKYGPDMKLSYPVDIGQSGPTLEFLKIWLIRIRCAHVNAHFELLSK